MKNLAFWFVTLIWFAGSNAIADPGEGEKIFQQKCAVCHKIGGGRGVGPDLLGVQQTRDSQWLYRWIKEPDRILAEKDPIAVALMAEYNQIPMPNLGLSEGQVKSVLAYMDQASQGNTGPASSELTVGTHQMGAVQTTAFFAFLVIMVIIVGVFIWIGRSTGNPGPVNIQAAYKIRKVFFITGSLVVLVLLGVTLSKTPYVDALVTPDQIVYSAAMQYNFIFTDEPVAALEELQNVTQIFDLKIPVESLVEFRVTALDVTHGFGIYDTRGAILAQTQAMPGYTNRLRVRFTEPGRYNVLCLEYCGIAHHVMKTEFTVQ